MLLLVVMMLWSLVGGHRPEGSYYTMSGFKTTVSPQNATRKQQKVSATELSKMYNDVMKTYDKKFRPGHGENATLVKLEVQVLSFSEFDEGAMEFEMDFYFAQFWNDYRFKVHQTQEAALINLIGKEVENIWLPDTVFINSKESKFHDVTINNRFLSVNFNTGDLLYHSRITTKASCPMDLRDYPFDKQTCFLAIESYGHDKSDILYAWQDYNQDECTGQCRQIYVYDKEMSNFDVIQAIKSPNKTAYHAELFSSATAQFTFRRRAKYFLLQVYLPCVLIVMVTWTTFWITPSAVPARSAICVTTILTLITMLGIVNVNMPKVSYIKALDMYLFVSFIFVFLSLLEYILVLNFANHSRRKWQKRKIKEENEKQNHTSKSMWSSSDKAFKLSTQCQNGRFPISNGVNTRPRRSYADNFKSPYKDTIIDLETECLTNSTSNIDTGDTNKSERISNVLVWSSSRTDKAARFLFPLAFACFNIGYWTTYLAESKLYEEML